MLRDTDSFAYTDFSHADLKTIIPQFPPGFGAPNWGPRSGYWDPTKPVGGPGWSGGSKSGLIDSGPYPGTYSLHMQGAAPIWYRCYYMGPTRGDDWIVARWIYPINIVGTKSFVLFQQNTNSPNFSTVFGMQVRDDGKIVLNPQDNSNCNFFPALFDSPSFFQHWPTPTDGPAFAVSNATIPINTTGPTPGSAKGWTHVCLQVHFDPVVGGGRLKLWINGCLDLSGATLNMPIGANLITDTWNSTDGSELCSSQIVICDPSGPYNNSNVSQFATIQTVFPTSDVTTGWSGGYALVNSNPGPTPPGVNLITLATPDDLFGIPPLPATPQVLGVNLNMAMTAPTQTATGAFQVSGHIAVQINPTLDPLIGSPWTRQSITETNPFTGTPWTIDDINAAAWGMRGIAGTGTNVQQFFLEVLTQTGPATCGGSYSYGQ